MKLSELHIYPVKSCAALSLAEADVQVRGLAQDRRWLIVDDEGRFVTGRQVPRLVRVFATPLADGLRLESEGLPAMHVPTPAATAPRLRVTIWKDTVDAVLADEAAHAWLSRALGRSLRLAHMDEQARRPVATDYGRAGDEVSFADGFPLLVISQAALDGLNARVATPLPMLRFRPNLVIAGCAAHAEDGWRHLRIGAVEFEAVKPCTRCVFTTVDPATGTFDASGEPLHTLKTYRRSASGITFGMNLIARGTGILRVGDPVQVLA